MSDFIDFESVSSQEEANEQLTFQTHFVVLWFANFKTKTYRSQLLCKSGSYKDSCNNYCNHEENVVRQNHRHAIMNGCILGYFYSLNNIL